MRETCGVVGEVCEGLRDERERVGCVEFIGWWMWGVRERESSYSEVRERGACG